MLLSGALFALFMMGFWLYCLTDAILTPASECRGLSKPAWIAVITVTFVGGAVAWLVARERLRSTYGIPAPASRWDPDAPGNAEDLDDGYFRNERWTAADDAVARHPAGRGRAAGFSGTRAKGPDDDPDFLRALGRAIRGNPQPGGDLVQRGGNFLVLTTSRRLSVPSDFPWRRLRSRGSQLPHLSRQPRRSPSLSSGNGINAPSMSR